MQPRLSLTCAALSTIVVIICGLPMTRAWRLVTSFPLKSQLLNDEKKRQKEEQRNSTSEAAAESPTEGDKSKSSAEKPSANSNWEKFKSVVKEKDPKQKQPKRQHPHPGKTRKENFKAPRMYLPDVPSSSESGEPSSLDDKDTSKGKQLTKQIAIDCEMVGIGDGTDSMLARVSLVNRHGACIYDKYVKPQEKIQDYRTHVSGIRPHHLRDGEDFKVVQSEVAEILRGRLLIGHALKHDLNVLFLSHPRRHIRDTSRYKPFRKVTMGNTPSLKKLAAELLGVKIQTGEHNSIEDARTAMQLYMLFKAQWETDFHRKS